MIALDKTLLENTFLKEEAERLHDAGFIAKKQLVFIEANLPGYNKHNNLFARTGLFILGYLLQVAACGFLALFFLGSSDSHSFELIFVLVPVISFIMLETVLIRSLKYFGNGVDDAFLVAAQLGLIGFVAYKTDFESSQTITCFFTFILCLFCFLRYADSFSAFLSCLGLGAFIAALLLHSGSTGQSLLPFILMLVAALVYFIQGKLKEMAYMKTYYSRCITALFIFSAVLFYASGNYLLVREARTNLLYTELMPGEDIPFSYFFYAFTFLCPLAFIYFSLRTKNRVLLWIGLFAFGFSIYSIRYYYSVMPVELAMVGGGLALFGIGFLAIKKLSGKDRGLTYESGRFASSDELLNLEALSLIEKYGLKPGDTEAGADTEYGGGRFGGGGSGQRY